MEGEAKFPCLPRPTIFTNKEFLKPHLEVYGASHSQNWLSHQLLVVEHNIQAPMPAELERGPDLYLVFLEPLQIPRLSQSLTELSY